MAHAPLTLVPATCDDLSDIHTLPAPPSPPPAAETWPLPDVVGHWRLYGRVGQGSTANVFTVRCGRLVAVMKVERADATRSARGCIRREAHWLRSHPAPGRPTVLDEGQLDDGRAWFVMTLAPGQSLSDWWRAQRGADPVAAVQAIAKAARIMGDAHQQGWVHRDLKPSNLALGPTGEVTVLDWGLVHRHQPRHRTTARVAGTPGFIPPELFKTRRPDYAPALDTYALGCCLVVLLSADRVWPHQLHSQTVRTVVSGSGLTGVAARTLEHILGRAISRAPGQRWTDGHALADELECWLRCMAPAPKDSTWTPGSQLYRTPA